MRKFLTVLVALTLFAALLSVIVFTTDFNVDEVDTHVSLQAEGIADFGDQLVMEKPTGEKPSELIEMNTVDTGPNVIDAQGTARLIADGRTGNNLRPGISGLDLENFVLVLRSTSATSQGEVSAHPGSTRPILG